MSDKKKEEKILPISTDNGKKDIAPNLDTEKKPEEPINGKAIEALKGINESEPKIPPPIKQKPLAGSGIPKLVVSDEVKPKKRGRGRPKKEAEPEPIQLFTGDLLLFLTDQIVPKAMAFANNSLQKKESGKVNWEDLRLEPSDKAELKVIADKAASKIGILADPITTYAIMVGGIYAMKLFIPNEE